MNISCDQLAYTSWVWWRQHFGCELTHKIGCPREEKVDLYTRTQNFWIPSAKSDSTSSKNRSTPQKERIVSQAPIFKGYVCFGEGIYFKTLSLSLCIYMYNSFSPSRIISGPPFTRKTSLAGGWCWWSLGKRSILIPMQQLPRTMENHQLQKNPNIPPPPKF